MSLVVFALLTIITGNLAKCRGKHVWTPVQDKTPVILERGFAAQMERAKLSLKPHLPVVVCVVGLLYPLVYVGMYAGDAEIHLVYAQNAANGRLFEFNPGEKSSGVTSAGHMLFLASLFKLFPSTSVPLLVTIFNYIVWYGLILLIFRLSSLLIEDKTFVYISTLVSALLPGSAYNSTIGMENGTFGFLTTLILYLAVSWRWFATSDSRETAKEIILGTLMGIAVWIRPEGFVVCFLLLLCRMLWGIRHRRIAAVLKHSSTFLIPFLILGISLIYFHWCFTGELLPTSGRSRMTMGHQEGLSIIGIVFSPKFFIRILQYFPLTIFFLIGACLTIKEFKKNHVSAYESPSLFGRMCATILFTVFFVLYSTVLGGFHLGRYAIFIMPLMVLVSAYAASCAWKNWHQVFPLKPRWSSLSRYAVFGFLGMSLVIVFAFETYLRLGLRSHAAIKYAMDAPNMRDKNSEKLLERLGRPSKIPVCLAYQEVQIRYYLDQRFTIRSLDGRVDPLLLDYYRDGYFDHIGYIKKRHIDYVMELVNYNKDPNAWSLLQLERLSPGETLTHQGLAFKCLSSGIIQVLHPASPER